ncbi:hypothetical protein LguiB_031111 [Lonicera macranthoides]
MTPQPKPPTRIRTRRLSACYRHPAEPVTGFCALCLRDRLAGLQSSSGPPEPQGTSSLSPELRRSKSVSASRCEFLSGSSEPRRKSCDVRVRSTLSNLFNLDDEDKISNRDLKVESRNLALSRIEGDIGEEIRVSEDVVVSNLNIDGEFEKEEDFKTMKEYIDLELQSKKDSHKDLREIAGSLASVFSKKLRKWRQKQVKKRNTSNERGDARGDFLAMRINGLIRRELAETQSEIGEYRLGRRSCDTEPRFSVDAGRMSVDGSRFSFDEPRASWDGYLIARTIPRLTPMLSVVEDAMLANANKSIEEDQMDIINEDESTSGGSGHTNSDSSSQRGSSFDRSSSVRSCNRKTERLEADEQKSVINVKASPAKLVITEKELKDWRFSTLKDDHSLRVEPVRKTATPVPTGSTPNRVMKASGWRKVCKKWGFVPKFSDNKHQDFASNGIESPVVRACEKGVEVEGLEKRASTVKFSRSSSCVGSRSSIMESSATGVAETGGSAMKGRDEFVLERNKSTGYSPSDSGLLRFYLTPFRSYRLSKSGKSRPQESHLISKNALRLN